MPAAARVGDQVAHTKAMSSGIWGAVKGALVGALIGAAVIGLAVVTGGAALVVIGAALVAGGTVLGMAGRGFQQGVVEGTQNLGPPCGPITTGSANVFIEKKPAALACLSLVACSQHGGPKVPVATGSQTVFINTHAAARVGDLGTACGFVITQGSSTVSIGADKASCHGLQPGREVPEWAHDLAEGAIFLGDKMVLVGSILSIGGALRAIAMAPAAMRGLMTARVAGGMLGGYGGGQGGSWLGGRIFGEGSAGQQAMAFGGGLLGGVVGGGVAGRTYTGARNSGLFSPGSPVPARPAVPTAPNTRERLRSNLAQSRAARESSNFNGRGTPPSQPRMTRPEADRAARRLAESTARNYRNNPATSNRQLARRTMTTATVDARTGRAWTSFSGQPRPEGGQLNPSMATRQGQIARTPPETRWPINNCGEFKAVNQALNNGAQRGDLSIGTVRTKTGAWEHRCANCVHTTSGSSVPTDRPRFTPPPPPPPPPPPVVVAPPPVPPPLPPPRWQPPPLLPPPAPDDEP